MRLRRPSAANAIPGPWQLLTRSPRRPRHASRDVVELVRAILSPLLLAVPFGLAIGVIVGAVGAGGAILAFPVLVYVLGEGVGPASTASLIVVAVAAAVGGSALARHGAVCWRLALLFSAPAAAGSLVGAVANSAVSGDVLVLAFIPVMLAAAGATWQRAGADRPDDDRGCPQPSWRRVVAAGFGVGALTGFFGIGGGFLVVPLLSVWLGVGFRRAVATSLVIIALTGIAALASHLVAGAAPHVGLTAVLGGSTATGALLGTMVGRRLPQASLGRAFAVVVALVAVVLLVDTLVLGGPPAG
ncbi:MAG TPA: sulfite exporter TauE/SafE family protein [Solirubrobacteraceae bacterium]|nr:sulfite exporter TauE/SafE family protein [Solirubrobacteraceae bacterium]